MWCLELDAAWTPRRFGLVCVECNVGMARRIRRCRGFIGKFRLGLGRVLMQGLLGAFRISGLGESAGEYVAFFVCKICKRVR